MNYKTSIHFMLYTVMVLGLSGCKFSFLSLGSEDAESNLVVAPPVTPDEPQGPGQNLADDVPINYGSIGVKNFRSMERSLSLVTGVESNTGRPLTTMNSVRSLLPTTSDARSLSAPMMLAFVNLAEIYCEELINDDVAKDAVDRIAHKGINFSRNKPLTSLTAEQKEQVIEEYANLFWQRSVTEDEAAIVLDVMDEAEQGRGNQNDTSFELQKVLKSACVVVAASAENLQI